MTTAVQVAERALKRLLVQADDAPLDPSDYADFYESMNAFMASLEAENCQLGYTPVSAAADVVTVPDGCIRGLVANVAVDVASDYGITPSPSLAREAKSGLRVMRLLGRPKIKASYPAGLPQGSGQWDTYHDPLYGASLRCLLTLANYPASVVDGDGYQVTEFTTVSGIEQAYLAGYWETEYAEGVEATSLGEVRNALDGDVNVTVEFSANFTADTSDNYTLVLFTSDDAVIGASAASGTSGEFTVTGSVTLSAGESIQRAALVADSGNPLTLYNGRLKVY